MPFKFNASRRGKFAKAKYRVTNWAGYNEALRQRGDVTVWFGEDVVSGWSAERSGKRGAQQRYSDLAIETCLTLRVVFGLPLRQAQGFVRSLLRLMELALPVPDFSTFCRRAQTLEIVPDTRTASGPLTLIVDSTGLRVHRGRDWMREKHGLPKARKTWCKLYIGFDPEGGQIVASCLTTEHVGDPGALTDLLDNMAGPFAVSSATGPMTVLRPPHRSGTRLVWMSSWSSHRRRMPFPENAPSAMPIST